MVDYGIQFCLSNYSDILLENGYMISTILSIANLVVAGLLVTAILLQQKGTGIGAAFGGTTGVYTTRRGVDRILFNMTIAFSILFFAIALINVVI